MTEVSQSRPVSVILAGVSLFLLALWQFVVKAWPAISASDSSVLTEMVSVALTAYIAWGVLALQRWAWWLGVIITAVGSVITLGLLGSFEEFQAQVQLVDPEGASRTLTLLGAVSIAGFLCLITPSCRAAFRSG